MESRKFTESGVFINSNCLCGAVNEIRLKLKSKWFHQGQSDRNDHCIKNLNEALDITHDLRREDVKFFKGALKVLVLADVLEEDEAVSLGWEFAEYIADAYKEGYQFTLDDMWK